VESYSRFVDFRGGMALDNSSISLYHTYIEYNLFITK
jgi:hypothetical protein